MKFKKIIVILFVLLVSLGGIYLLNLNNETKYAKALSFDTDEQILAIFFLGGLEGEYDYSLINKYYKNDIASEFRTIELGGQEKYLVVPRYNIETKIYSLSMAEDGRTTSNLVTTTDEPFYIKCNLSDIFSNVQITMEHNNKEYTYSPYISLKDGSVVTEPFVKLVEK